MQEMQAIAGTTMRAWRPDPGRGRPALFLHGGIPGSTPYCAGAHVWDGCLDAFRRERDLIVPDLPGSGGSPLPDDAPTLDGIGRAVVVAIEALGTGPCDVVGHDLGGLLGLWLGMERPDLVRSLSVVASPMSPPTGDSLDDLTLLAAPRPPWTRPSQRWVLERLSYAHQHVDARLLDACAAAADGSAHRRAAEIMADGGSPRFAASVQAAKGRLWALCRGGGIPVPTGIVWSSDDPLTRRDAGFALFRIVAARQPAAQFHLINRAGHFPFREQPEAFHQVVAAFQDGCAAEAARRGTAA